MGMTGPAVPVSRRWVGSGARDVDAGVIELEIQPKRLKLWRSLKPAPKAYISRIVDGALSFARMLCVCTA